MELRIPIVLGEHRASCRLKGFKKQPGDFIVEGEILGELRLELEDDAFSDCPVVHYGDLKAGASCQVLEVLGPVRHQGDLLALVRAEVASDEGGFPVTFETF